jgi:hypothetical protein
MVRLLLSFSLCGCFRFGPAQLDDDQLGYTRALSQSEKRQTLLNVVRIRYGDAPIFLDTTQVISGYQLQRSVTGGFEVFPNTPPGTFLSGNASAQLQESPTFTFQPVTGDHFAQSFLRPLGPTDLLPLIHGGLPVDVLFRLAVQSIGALQNTTGLQQHGGEGSPDFFVLLHDLRRLQIAGLIGVRIGPEGKPEQEAKATARPAHVFLAVAPTGDPALATTEAEVLRLLAVPPRTTEVEVVYGRTSPDRLHVAMITRSMLGVLGQLAFQIEAPAQDVARGWTVPSVGQIAVERRPVVLVRSGGAAPDNAFVAVEYQHEWFWVDQDDFDSKIAFSIVNILLALAKISTAPGTVITVPVR